MSFDYEYHQSTKSAAEEAKLPAHLTYDYPPTHRETIERYIAVPINSTDHLLLSSTGTGQQYLAEPVANLLSATATASGAGDGSRHNTAALLSSAAAHTSGGTGGGISIGGEGGSTAPLMTAAAAAVVATTATEYDKPPPPVPAPTYERPSPLGASSRSTSKLSIDKLDCETKF